MTPRATVLVFGSINTDLVVYLPRLPHPGETVSRGTFSSFPGGKGANSAVAAARAGAAVGMFGAVGADSFGEERIRSLGAEGIRTGGIVIKPGSHSGIAQIWVDERGENSIAVAPGANALFADDDVADIPPTENGGVAAFQNEVPQEATEALLERCKRRGYTTVWNIAPECSALPAPSTLADSDYLILNENEVRTFAALLDARDGGRDSRSEHGATESGRLEVPRAEALAARLVAEGARNVIVTLGRAGSVWVGAQRAHLQRAFEVEAVDTVGAGDCFCGVFAASLASGLTTAEAIRRAAAAAAVSVTRRGAQTSMPTAAEVDAFLRERGGGATRA